MDDSYSGWSTGYDPSNSSSASSDYRTYGSASSSMGDSSGSSDETYDSASASSWTDYEPWSYDWSSSSGWVDSTGSSSSESASDGSSSRSSSGSSADTSQPASTSTESPSDTTDAESIVDDVALGLLQGALNGVEAVTTDIPTSIGNILIAIPNTIADAGDWMYGTPEERKIRLPYIPESNWAQSKIAPETDDDHGWSTFGTGMITTLIPPAWLGKLGRFGGFLDKGDDAARALQSTEKATGSAQLLDDAAKAADDAARAVAPKSVNQLSKSQQNAVNSLTERAAEHQKKLADYMNNPDAFDNQGLLKNAPTPDIRQKIIDGRIRHLQQEIKAFQDQIDQILGDR